MTPTSLPAPLLVKEACILAGGQSRRMETNKALLRLDGIPMIERIANVMRSVFADVWISANDSEAYRFLNLSVVKDVFPHLGPLAGIHAALQRTTTSRVFILSCDTPLITADLIRHILSTESQAPVVIASEGERTMPLCGVYHTSITASLEKYLRSGGRKVHEFLASHETTMVRFDERISWYRPGMLSNVNDREDYERVKGALYSD